MYDMSSKLEAKILIMFAESEQHREAKKIIRKRFSGTTFRLRCTHSPSSLIGEVVFTTLGLLQLSDYLTHDNASVHIF